MIEFDKTFQALTSHRPMRWQVRLFALLRSGADIPRVCDIPTGLGKTSVIPIWLIGLAQQAEDGHVILPRRLVYIVNRRTVVDQASNVVMGIRERLLWPCKSEWAEHKTALHSLAASLKKLTPEPPLVAVSTLRGELADNEEWKDDPARAAIIVGTIDLIGSKLLFSGYGDGPYKRAHHAGLIGQDTMIVHDESHLTPAFSDLLRGVEEIQVSDHEPRPIRVMELSATQRSSDTDDVFRLEVSEQLEPMVLARLNAQKRLLMHSPKGKQVQQLVDLAHKHDDSQAKVLVYIRSPEDAQRVSDGLRKKLGKDSSHRVALLTGTIRGRERDRLVTDHPVYPQMLDPDARLDETVYLVSTSAGEVGIDIDADHMVCDLTTLDSMVQRLGRVNRFGGEERKARVDVVWTEKDEDPGKNEVAKSVAKTLQIFQEWENGGTIDASPRNVLKLIQELSDEDKARAFSPKPAVPPLTDILLDAWALTSIDDMPGRPDVAPYLHGQTNDPPETYIAWRNEVPLFDRHSIDDLQLRNWFRSCRIRSDERLSDRTDRVTKFLRSLHSEHVRKRRNGDFAVVVLSEHGKAEILKLPDVIERNIEYTTVVLPVEAGGLDPNGTLDHKRIEPVLHIDVADSCDENFQRQRWLCRSGETQVWKRLLSDESEWSELEPDGWSERTRIALKDYEEADEGLGLVLRMPGKQLAADDPGIAAFRQTLAEHKNRIGRHMESIADRLGLEPHTGSALVSAAIRHDDGKDRRVWQHYACNDDSEPLAKSVHYRRPRVLGGYRHELGSMLDATRDDSLLTAEERNLILHVIAAHHGHARPHFPERGFDNERFSTHENQQAAIEVMRRFGRLQNRFGRWGLAWLESLMRCADIAASRPPREVDKC